MPAISHSILGVLLMATVGLAAACRTPDPVPSDADDAREAVECTEPRFSMCTQDYRPVCGLRDTGIRCVTTPCNSIEWKTYSNGCTACSDPSVSEYRPGACDETQQPATPSD